MEGSLMSKPQTNTNTRRKRKQAQDSDVGIRVSHANDWSFDRIDEEWSRLHAEVIPYRDAAIVG